MSKKDNDAAANKALVREFFVTLSTRGIDHAAALLDESLIWWTAPAVYSKQEIVKTISGQDKDLAKPPVKLTVRHLTAEEDRVAVEVESHAVLKNGRIYANKYHWLLWVHDGKITEIHEHCDTYHAVRIWGDSLPLYAAESASTPKPAAWPEPVIKR